MLLSIAADERAALHFDDLASAFDAGLSLEALGGRGNHGERVVHELLRQRGVTLRGAEDAVLTAGWQAGRVGTTLRARAEERRRQAAFARQIWAGLRYPLVLFVLIGITGFLVAGITDNLGIVYVELVVLAAVGATAWFGVRSLRRGGEGWLRIPVVGNLASGLAELPYLETLQAMYGAGVPLAQAHPRAVAAVPVLGVQRRLQVADGVLRSGRPLGEALAQALALHPETRMLLTTGEQTGQLEEALQRALVRRRDVTGRAASDAARRFGSAAYLLAIVAVGYFVITFYVGYFAKLGLH